MPPKRNQRYQHNKRFQRKSNPAFHLRHQDNRFNYSSRQDNFDEQFPETISDDIYGTNIAPTFHQMDQNTSRSLKNFEIRGNAYNFSLNNINHSMNNIQPNSIISST
ncbi:1635_t:CDS:2 [Racocetra fulgida]|uniref:1635_t:CDS:1 n=1 Tax=Racocetra fulgida TaxID=60492 RepID=A0A9N8VMQ0_9GLOM|nr:1635_t:CDS:2 [Racocetra fulgida]